MNKIKIILIIALLSITSCKTVNVSLTLGQEPMPPKYLSEPSKEIIETSDNEQVQVQLTLLVNFYRASINNLYYQLWANHVKYLNGDYTLEQRQKRDQGIIEKINAIEEALDGMYNLE